MNLESIEAGLLNVRLFDIGGKSITPATLLLLCVILAGTLVVSFLLQRGFLKALSIRGIKDEGTLHVAQRLTHYVVLAVGLGVGLETIGIDLSALFAASAVLAIGIGFATQNLTQNFASGLILLLERTIKPGDVLRVEDNFVRVERLGFRSTIARTLNDEQIVVPNSTIAQSIVTNYTLRDSLYRLRTAVGVVYASDMAVVRRTLEDVARAQEWRYREKDPVVLLTEFGSSSVNFEVSVWVDDPWNSRRCLSALNEAIWWALKREGVTIAFPQLDLHLDGPVVESLQALRRPA